MVIYGDILLVVNWWIDFLLLLGVGRTLCLGARPWRLAIGALLGALSAFTLFLPAMPVWLSLPIKFVAAMVMVAVAFSWHGWRAFWRQVLLLFGLSAGLAGVCGALYFFVAPTGFYVFNGVVYYSVPPLLLVGLTAAGYVLLSVIEHLTGRRAPATHRFQVRLHVGQRSVTVTCLYDSGNHLSEPFSNRPVMVVERGVAERLLPVPATPEDLPPPGSTSWRLVPYDTLGGQGVLPAFVPDSAVAILPTGEKVLPPCYVAVCDHLGKGEYRGLLSSVMGEVLLT